MAGILSIFRRRKVMIDAAGDYWTKGEVFDPGAEGMAFHTIYLHPLQSIVGGGVPVQRSLNVSQPPQVYQSLALPTEPLIAGHVVGMLYNAPLSQNSNEAVQS